MVAMIDNQISLEEVFAHNDNDYQLRQTIEDIEMAKQFKDKEISRLLKVHSKKVKMMKSHEERAILQASSLRTFLDKQI